MKRLLPLVLLLLLSAVASAAGPLRVLFLGQEGGPHRPAACLPFLMEQCGREAIYFDYRATANALTSETLAQYDAVLLDTDLPTIEPGQFAALQAFVESGHGLLAVHTASAAFGNEPRVARWFGAPFVKTGEGEIQVTLREPQHPILEGVTAWVSRDESANFASPPAPDAVVLLEGSAAGPAQPWAWVRPQGQGRVFYLAGGHEERSWRQPAFLRVLRNAVVWSVGDARRQQWEEFLAQREPEVRTAHPDVANYEKRPTPVTLQQPFSVKGSMERTQVPAGMHLELFAAEPEIAKPIALAWDERGRLWVAETRDYPHGVAPGGEGHDDIKICEDTDGDGRADKFTIFAEKLNLPTSLVFARSGLIVSQPPNFLFLRDTDGDDRADVRKVLLQGWGIADTHAQASSLQWGLDNWIHGCVGYSGFRGTIGGQEHSFSMGTYRFAPDGGALEFLHQASNNAWGQSQNAAGDDFLGSANNAPLLYGGIPAGVIPPGTQLMTGKKINAVDLAHAITPNFRQVDVFGGFTAAAGCNFVESRNLPAQLQGRALVCEPTMKLISLQDVRPQGAGYTGVDDFNLVASTDEWMSPVFAAVGPDGAVWFADWQNFIIQHNPTPSVARGGYAAKTGPGGAHENPLRDHARGRIYRVVWDQAQPPARKSLQGATAEQMVQALSSDTAFWRLTAQRLLVEGKKVEAAPALRTLTAGPAAIPAIHALWTLHGMGALDAATQQAALVAQDPALRRNAVRTLEAVPASQGPLTGAAFDGDPMVRLAARVKLAELPTTPELQTLVRGMAAETPRQGDEWLREANKLLVRRHRASAAMEGPNLLPNPGFEMVTAEGAAAGWQRRDGNDQPGSRGAEWKPVDAERLRHTGERAVRCITREPGETRLFAEVAVKPKTTYRLSGWIKTHAFSGAAFLRDEIGRVETERVTAREGGWVEVEATLESGERTQARIVLVHQGKGDSHFDDVKLCELGSDSAAEEKPLAGDPQRGEGIFYKHPATACVLCHMLKGQGSTVGPALDGLATRATPEYIAESLLKPNKVLAKGYEALGASPMPPMGLILKPQELEDVKAFLQTLR